MRSTYSFEKNGQEYSLADCVEFLALDICEDISQEKRTEEIMQKCKILDSLSNALLVIKK